MKHILRILQCLSVVFIAYSLGGCRGATINFSDNPEPLGLRYTTTACELTNGFLLAAKMYKTKGTSMRLSDTSFVLAKRMDEDGKKRIMECYNNRTQLLWSKPIELDTGEYGLQMLLNNGNVCALHRRVAHDSFQLCLRRYEATTGNIITREVLLHITKAENYEKTVYWMTFSPDSSRILVVMFSTDPDEAEKDESFNGLCVMYDSNFKQLWKEVIHFGATASWRHSNGLHFTVPMCIDNNGAIYLSTVNEGDKKLEVSITQFQQGSVKKTLVTHADLSSIKDDVEGTRGSMTMLKDGSIGYVLTLKDGDDLVALAYCRANFPKGEISDIRTIEYTKAFREKYLGEEKAMDYFQFRELFTLPDGNLIVVTEFQEKRQSPAMKSGLRDSPYYISGDILLTAMTPDGSPIWLTSLPKKGKQYDTEGISYMRTEVSGEMSFWGANSQIPGYAAYKVDTKTGKKKAIAFPFVCETDFRTFQFNRPQLVRMTNNTVACFGEDAVAFYVMVMDFSRIVE